MGTPQQEQIKHREICFRGPHPDSAQAQSAALLLSDLEGVHAVHLCPTNQYVLHISYDVRYICLQFIEEILVEVGYHLDNSLLLKVKRAVYYYTEEIERQNHGCQNENCTRNIFIENYRRHVHGCRDERPEYWRKYL